VYKQPEGFLDLEQLATGPRGPRLGRLLPTRRRVSRTLGEPPLHLSANPDDGRPKRRPCQRPIADSMPQPEQLAGLFQQALPPFSQVADPPTRGFRPRATWLRCLKRSGTQEGTVSSWIPLRSIQATLA
jgi:hypothetical protein